MYWAYNPNSIREHGCPRCNKSKTRKWTHEEYVDAINEIFDGNIIVLEEYQNMSTKIKHKCLKHNFEYLINPAHALRKQGCKYCGYEITSKKRTKPLDIFLKELYDKRGDEFSYISGYVNSSTNAIFRHHMSDGSYHDFQMTPNSMTSSRYNCPCCSGYQVYVGFNDFNTKRPELAKSLLNYEDGFKYTEWSGASVGWKCPECNYILNKKISYVSKYGIACPRCNDGFSYPNKFMYNSLLQIESDFDFLEREFKPEWCRYYYNEKECYGRYDIFFSIKGNKYIVEMDGGLGHGNRSYTNSDRSMEELIFRDKMKDELANEHEICVIRVDCDYGTNDKYEYILNNILNSELSNIIDLSSIDFQKANLISQDSLFIKAIKLWNEGMSVSEIKEQIKVHESTVTNYLKRAKKYGMCDTYSIQESRYRSISNAVVCLTTNKEFKSITDGAKFYNIFASDISKCCRKISTFGGWFNGKKLIWIYKKDYDLLSEEDIKNYIPKQDDNFTKVVCLNTGKVYDGLIYAAKEYNLKGTGSISACCAGRYNSVGKDKNGILLKWRYLSDYEKMSQNEIDKILNYERSGWKKVICLNNLMIFDNETSASGWCNLDSKLHIQSCCRGEIKSSGIHPETQEPLRWMYYSDYIKEFGEVVKIA